MDLILNAPVALLLQETTRPHMTAGGWIFMAAAWLFILTLTFYTFSKILRNKK